MLLCRIIVVAHYVVSFVFYSFFVLFLVDLSTFLKSTYFRTIHLLTTVGYCCRQGIHCYVRPQPMLNKVIKVKDNKQKPKDACPAQTEAESELQPKITTSRPACSNTFVMCRRICRKEWF